VGGPAKFGRMPQAQNACFQILTSLSRVRSINCLFEQSGLKRNRTVSSTSTSTKRQRVDPLLKQKGRSNPLAGDSCLYCKRNFKTRVPVVYFWE